MNFIIFHLSSFFSIFARFSWKFMHLCFIFSRSLKSIYNSVQKRNASIRLQNIFYAFLFKNANFFASTLFVGRFLLCFAKYVAHVHVEHATVCPHVRLSACPSIPHAVIHSVSQLVRQACRCIQKKKKTIYMYIHSASVTHTHR